MANEKAVELKDLKRELNDLSWPEVKDAAIQLGIKLKKLELIERKYSDESERFSAAMQLWLDTDTKASWMRMVEALSAIEKRALAKDLEEKYCRPALQPTPTAPPDVTHGDTPAYRAFRRSYTVFKKGVDPNSLVALLYSSFLLTDDEKSRALHATKTDYEKLDIIFNALESRVVVQPDSLKKIIRAIGSDPALEPVANVIQGNSNIYGVSIIFCFNFSGFYKEECDKMV